MKNILKFKGFMLLVVILMFVVGCSSNDSNASTDTSGDSSDLPELEIKVSGVNSNDHPQTIGLFLFKDIIEAGSDGKITVQIHPNSELGGELETVEQVKNGTLEMA